MNPDKKVRRVQSLLYTSGLGTVLFSIWSGIRGLESLFEIWKELAQEHDEIDIVVNVLLCLFIFVLLMVVTFLYVYIGKTAMEVSIGKKKGNLYLILAVLFSLISWFSYIPYFTNGEQLEVKTLIYLVIDITSNIILIEIIAFSLLLKKIS